MADRLALAKRHLFLVSGRFACPEVRCLTHGLHDHPPTMDILHDMALRRFTMSLPDGSQAMVQYALSADGQVMNLYHVFVPESARGQGLAATITQAALDHARMRNWKVIPTCPYAAGFMARHEAYRSLLK